MSIAHTCIYDTLESCKYAKYWYGKPVVSKCKDCNRNPNNYPKTQVGTKDEMKDKISMALKDPILQQGFEVICKNLAELEKENAQLKSKNCWKTCEYAEPKSQWISQHIQDVVQLTKAKEIIKDYMTIVKGAHTTVCGVPEENRTINVLKLNKEAEEFLNSEVEK